MSLPKNSKFNVISCKSNTIKAHKNRQFNIMYMFCILLIDYAEASAFVNKKQKKTF